MSGFFVVLGVSMGILMLIVGFKDVIEQHTNKMNEYNKELRNSRVKSSLEEEMEKKAFKHTSEYRDVKNKIELIKNSKVKVSVSKLLESLKDETEITESEMASLYKLLEGISFAEEANLSTTEMMSGVKQVEETFLAVKLEKKEEGQEILNSMLEKF